MALHIVYTNSSYFLFLFFLNLLHLAPFLLLAESNCIYFLLLLICLIYKTIFYFTMVKQKLTPIFTPNILESMIEYTLISSILDIIGEMTIRPGNI